MDGRLPRDALARRRGNVATDDFPAPRHRHLAVAGVQILTPRDVVMNEHAAEFNLDIIGALEGTDKSSSVSLGWDYLRHYQSLFAPWRDSALNVIEIGVGQGHSLNVWKAYFSRAQIVGVDINPNCGSLAGDRVAIETGSQEDPGFLHRVCAKYPPTIVIDDGSHLAHHIVYTFKCVFPALEPGGLYIVEDLEFHFGNGYVPAAHQNVSAPDYFLGLARGRMANRTAIGEMWGGDQYIRDHIDSVSFIGGAVAIHKRKPRDIPSALEFAQRYLQSVNVSPAHLLRLAAYILYHQGSPEDAERAVLAAVSLGGRSAEALRWLAEVKIRQGRLDEAAASADEAARLRPDDHESWNRLSRIERQRGETTNALAAIERAVSLNPRQAHYHDQLCELLRQQGDLRRALTAAKKAAELVTFEPWQRRVTELERLAADSHDA